MRNLIALLLCATCVLFSTTSLMAGEEKPEEKKPEEKKEEPVVVPDYSAEDMICQPSDLAAAMAA